MSQHALAAVGQIAADPNSFGTLVAQLQLPDDNVRRQAEEVFELLKDQPDLCISCLVHTLRTSPTTDARAFCAIMLRKVYYHRREGPEQKVLWDLCSDHVQANTKRSLLEALVQEQDRSVAAKVSQSVSDLAMLIIDKPTGWPELLPAITACLQSNQPLQMTNALHILGDVAPYMTEQLKAQAGQIAQWLGAFMGPTNNKDVQVAAATAAGSFMEAYEEAPVKNLFAPLLQPMLAMLGQLLSTGDEENAKTVLEIFNMLAEGTPRFLRQQLGPLVEAMMRIGAAVELDEDTRASAVEFLVTLCEAREQAPGMMRKLPNFARSLFELVMGFLLSFEDEPEWHGADSDKHENAGASELFDAGQEYLDRIAISLGGKAVSDAASQLLGAWLSDADWHKRQAVFICLAQIAEGCQKVMSSPAYLEQVARMCVMGLSDANPHVRWSACQALGQMCTDLGPMLQAKQHAVILPALMRVMADQSSPRVQAHACAAIVNFSEGVESDVLPPYLDNLIQILLTLLQTGAKLVQEGALTALASVADSSQELFIRYYDHCMPLLMHILTSASAKEHRLMRAKALECISLVGMAVGKDRFRADARSVLAYMQTVQQERIDPDDPLSSYMLQAGARLCKCLGSEFIEYLPLVMPALMASARADPDVQIVDAEDADEADLGDDLDVIPMGDKALMYKSSVLEEKATAVNMLSCYAEQLEEGFLPYVIEVLNLVLKGTEGQSALIKFYLNEEIRRAAAAMLPALLRCVVSAVEKGVPGVEASNVAVVLGMCWGPLLESLKKEPEGEIQAAQLEAIGEIVDQVDKSLLLADGITSAFAVFDHVLGKAESRRAERIARTHAEDFDQEEAEALEQENLMEEELFEQVAVCVGAFLKKFGDDVLVLVESLLAARYGAMLTGGKDRSDEERRIAVCLVDDLLENSPAGRAKHFNNVFPILLECSGSSHSDLRQTSVYGLGVLAAKSPELFRPHAKQVADLVAQIISHPEAKSEDNENATDNATSTLGKILAHHAEALGPDGGAQHAAAWLRALPIKADTVEAVVMHEQLVGMCEQNDPRVAGHIPQLASIFVEVLGHGTNLVAGPVGLRMAQLLRQLQPSVPAEAVSGAMARLTPKQQESFNAYMSGQVPQAPAASS